MALSPSSPPGSPAQRVPVAQDPLAVLLPPGAQGPPVPEPGDDTDGQSSDYGEDDYDSYSITSSILDYQYENGRRYASGRYLMLMGGELYIAPLVHPQRVLDLGTGTGSWAIDFADNHPEATVLGNDLSPIQPSWVPPNVEFLVDDVESDWLDKPNTYDFIHSRGMAGCVADWHRLYRQAYRHLKPGGYFELQESAVWAWSDDGSLRPDSPLGEYLRALDDAGQKIGRDLNITHKLSPWLTAHGFEDVHEETYILPFSPWPRDARLKEIGKVQAVMVQDAVEAYGLRLCTQVLGWSSDRFRIMQALVRQQLKDPDVHAYTKIVAAYGRKPRR
ncbi:S-adenosyl-L-methionine-dependent methyltransferase [Aspergillus ellipticus CBS 707.79]|uniref:S-adenosyl-L-methionine-dependent methyltransferase n=1 Tax=Aspergillus ellipticus CBS 707.79 TaxID=1448320 RepID=A0A319CXN5_9EURO|nr:S-adenosyl-L-methionine-dependent methyltransferase [Aspergillus ellipticus CBS 707.79]